MLRTLGKGFGSCGKDGQAPPAQTFSSANGSTSGRHGALRIRVSEDRMLHLCFARPALGGSYRNLTCHTEINKTSLLCSTGHPKLTHLGLIGTICDCAVFSRLDHLVDFKSQHNFIPLGVQIPQVIPSQGPLFGRLERQGSRNKILVPRDPGDSKGQIILKHFYLVFSLLWIRIPKYSGLSCFFF